MYAPYEPYAPNAPAMPFGAALPATTTAPILTAGIAAVRAQPCYSQEFEDCINTAQPSGLRDCETIRAAYKVDAKAMDAALQSVHYCPAPSTARIITIGAIGVAAGLLLGALLR